jgi:cyclopropane-fatty-acyl-phospholipid synthase
VATQTDIDNTYGYLDELWRLSLGDGADITCPLYDGDFSKPLDQAQRDKHTYILTHLNVLPNTRFLDIGCGWGGLLRAARTAGALPTGLTLASCQHTFCQHQGLDVRLQDWRTASPDSLGQFHAIASVGAFEHFCSEEEFLAGHQPHVYRRFFQLCRSLLPKGHRLYLQTMLQGPKFPPRHTHSLRAPRGSDEYILACLRSFYPGSWLPENLAQIQDAASPLFTLLSHKNGRADYAHTMALWGRSLRRLTRPKLAALARILRAYPRRDPALLRKLETLLLDYNAEVFRRHLFDHERLVFQAI